MSETEKTREQRIAEYAANPKNQTIELDCAPGSPRPGDLIGGVIDGTGLPQRVPTLMFFGNWMWDYSDVAPEVWVSAQDITRPRIEKLYHAGIIRYGSW